MPLPAAPHSMLLSNKSSSSLHDLCQITDIDGIMQAHFPQGFVFMSGSHYSIKSQTANAFSFCSFALSLGLWDRIAVRSGIVTDRHLSALQDQRKQTLRKHRLLYHIIGYYDTGNPLIRHIHYSKEQDNDKSCAN